MSAVKKSLTPQRARRASRVAAIAQLAACDGWRSPARCAQLESMAADLTLAVRDHLRARHTRQPRRQARLL